MLFAYAMGVPVELSYSWWPEMARYWLKSQPGNPFEAVVAPVQLCNASNDGTVPSPEDPDLLPHTLVVAEEECSVLEDRAAHGTAELVLQASRITGSLWSP